MTEATTTSAERRTGLLRKIRGLMDTADSLEAIGHSEAAQNHRNKADNLMTMYAIEEFELAAQGENNGKQAPEIREYQYGDMPREISEEMTQIFYAVATHCRCKVGWFGWSKSKIVGYPADLEYLDVLFTGIRMHMSANVRPTPGREMGYEGSLAILKGSGMKWKDVYLSLLPLFPERFVGTVANVSKQKRSTYDGKTDYNRDYEWWKERDDNPAHDPVPWFEHHRFTSNYVKVGDAIFVKEIPRPIGVRFTKEYTTFCQETGRERVYSDPSVWLKSYVAGYGFTIRQRLRDMAKSTSEATTGKELVLKSIAEDLMEFFYQCFPEQRPHPANCDCDQCHFCLKAKCQRPRCRDSRRVVRYRSPKETAISHEAMTRGSQAAKSADLTGRDRRVGSNQRKEIG